MRQFTDVKEPTVDNMFVNVSENIVVYINKDRRYFMSQLEKVKCHKIDSSADWKLNQYKINTKNGKCLNNCTNEVEYEYNGKCYENCSNGYYINNTKKICKCELEKCFSCPPIALQKKLCSK